MQPGHALVIHPLTCGEARNVPDDLQPVIDRRDRTAVRRPGFDPRLQYAHMQLVDRHMTDPGHQSLEAIDVVDQAALVLMIEHEN